MEQMPGWSSFEAAAASRWKRWMAEEDGAKLAESTFSATRRERRVSSAR